MALPQLTDIVFKQTVMQTLCYGSQLWLAHEFFPEDLETNVLQKMFNDFSKRLLHLPQSTPSVVVMFECAKYPMLWYLMRRFARYYVKVNQHGSVSLRNAVNNNVAWRPNADTVMSRYIAVTSQFDVTDVMSKCRQEWCSTLLSLYHGNPRLVDCMYRMKTLYVSQLWDGRIGRYPAYWSWKLPPDVFWNVFRFRCMQVQLPIITDYHLHVMDRRCQLCGCPAPDYKHLLIMCPHEQCELIRQSYLCLDFDVGIQQLLNTKYDAVAQMISDFYLLLNNS
jgi:hypothetical protein